MMAKAFECRPASGLDHPALLALLRSCGLPVEDIAPDKQEFLVSGPRESLDGCVGIERRGRFGLVRSLAVAEGKRGTGLGAYLLRKIVARAVESDIDCLYLLTTTASDFFGKRGFTVIGRGDVPPEIAHTEEFSSICPLSSIVMRLCCGTPIRHGAFLGA